MRMKNHLKTKEMARQKVCKENNFNRNRSQKKNVKTKGTEKTGAKRKLCQENGMRREKNVKGRRSQKKEMPKDEAAKKRDVNGKRLKRHQFQETVTTSERHCQERRVCQVSDSELSTRRAAKFQRCQGQTGSREIGIIRQ